MKILTRATSIAATCVLSLAAENLATAQQPAGRDFDKEITTALASAKEAAQFDFLGTLVRTCLRSEEHTSELQSH